MPTLFQFTFQAMGSPCQLQFYTDTESRAQHVCQKITRQVQRLEAKYSRYRPDSLLSQINRSAGSAEPFRIDSETAVLLAYAEQCFMESDGLFDVTSGILRQIWNFNEPVTPNTDEIESLLPLIGWGQVQWDEYSICLPKAGMALDFGGIVKEYAADAAASLCVELVIDSGVLEFGGDVRVIGAQPDGQGWPIAIRDPRYPNQIATHLNLTQGALASSGDYERYLEIDGVRYSHILNPKTGWPVTGLRAVSVVAEHCIVAGSIATIAMLKGVQGGTWLEQQQLAFFCCSSTGQVINQLH
jgi:thiamine biosynthesis lipoprotein